MNPRWTLSIATVLLCALFATAQPIAPASTIKLFNGKDLTGLTTWLKASKRDDPNKVFTVKDGVLHLSGEGFGYVATEKEYRDYHLTVEYKWGKRTDGGKYVRNSGVLLHATGPDGGGGGTWMTSFECQLAQGCVGDLIVIPYGKNVPLETRRLIAETEVGPDKRPRWKSRGEPREFNKGQLWWNKHEAFFKELLDTRGKDDLESPLGEWTKVECICRKAILDIYVNGTKVNQAYNLSPDHGKILLQTEGFEIYFRTFELKPIEKYPVGKEILEQVRLDEIVKTDKGYAAYVVDGRKVPRLYIDLNKQGYDGFQISEDLGSKSTIWAQVRVKRVDSKHLIFETFDFERFRPSGRHYVFRLGQKLSDSLTKQLTEQEVKDLGLIK